MPNRENTFLIREYASALESNDSRYSLKLPKPNSLSTTIKILSYSVFISGSLNFGSFVIKSITIDVHVSFGTAGGCSKLYGLYLECFAFLHVSQLSTYY